MKISERIRQLRIKKGLTMKETAKQLGVPTSTYRDWEYGRKVPGEVLRPLAQVFGVAVTDFTGTASPIKKDLSKVILLLEESLLLLRGTL